MQLFYFFSFFFFFLLFCSSQTWKKFRCTKTHTWQLLARIEMSCLNLNHDREEIKVHLYAGIFSLFSLFYPLMTWITLLTVESFNVYICELTTDMAIIFSNPLQKRVQILRCLVRERKKDISLLCTLSQEATQIHSITLGAVQDSCNGNHYDSIHAAMDFQGI